MRELRFGETNAAGRPNIKIEGVKKDIWLQNFSERLKLALECKGGKPISAFPFMDKIMASLLFDCRSAPL